MLRKYILFFAVLLVGMVSPVFAVPPDDEMKKSVFGYSGSLYECINGVLRKTEKEDDSIRTHI